VGGRLYEKSKRQNLSLLYLMLSWKNILAQKRYSGTYKKVQ